MLDGPHQVTIFLIKCQGIFDLHTAKPGTGCEPLGWDRRAGSLLQSGTTPSYARQTRAYVPVHMSVLGTRASSDFGD